MYILCLHVVSLCFVLQKVRPLTSFKRACSLLLRIVVKRLNFTLEFLRQFLVFYPIVVSQVAFVLGLKAAPLLFTVETEAFVLHLDVQVHVSNCAGTEVTPVTRVFDAQVLNCHVCRQTLLRCECPTAMRTELPESLVYYLANDIVNVVNVTI